MTQKGSIIGTKLFSKDSATILLSVNFVIFCTAHGTEKLVFFQVAPKRKNPTYIRAKEWKVDSKVISVKVSVNPDSILYDRTYVDDRGISQNSLEDALGCAPNKAYMQENPIRATLYHKKEGHTRITRYHP